jgi:hypothetical protein
MIAMAAAVIRRKENGQDLENFEAMAYSG